MAEKAEIISEFEDLIKIKKFYNENKTEPYICTYEQIKKAIENEYIEKLDEKINRWVNSTHVLYFKNVSSVFFYFQAKMLYRDGFYESSIAMTRSICEMICYDLLSVQRNPFIEDTALESENFRTLLKFLAIPKIIDQKEFEDIIIKQITDINDRNFVKSSYTYKNDSMHYEFKIEKGKNIKNLNRFRNIFNDIAVQNKSQ